MKKKETVKARKAESCMMTFAVDRCVVGNIYNGNSWAYGTCRIDVDTERYDLVRIAFAKDARVEEGDTLSVSGHVRAFFNADKKVTEYTFYADDITEVD